SSDGLIIAHMPPGQWNHVVIVGDPSGVRAYLNGVLARTAGPFTLQSNLVELGTQATNWFDGRIDEVYVFSRALKDSEIAGLPSRVPLAVDTSRPNFHPA